MKTLHLRRHSLKDGPNDTIGPKGLELAEREGRLASRDLDLYKVFHGPLVRTAQSALSFFLSYNIARCKAMPVVLGLGDSALFAEIATPEFREAAKNGLSYFQATLQTHGEEKTKVWANDCLQAVKSMFAQMEDGETAIGFFHSPTIELAAWACGAEQSGLANWDRFGEMEGLVFDQNYDQEISVTDKISVQPDASA